MISRERLPDTRSGLCHHFTVRDDAGEEHDGYIQTGCYPDGRLGEVFVRFGKEGRAGRLIDMWAVECSLSLQRGVPVREVFARYQRQQLEPAGWTGNPEIPRCTSAIDYAASYLILRYGGPE